MALIAASVHDAALKSAHCEQQYAISTSAITQLIRDETERRLCFEILVLQHELDELGAQLQDEQDASERARSLVDEQLFRAGDAEALNYTLKQQLSLQEHQIANLNTELTSLRNTTHDTSSTMAEKLALARELSIVKPELQHLKAQATSVEKLMTEKLALQRQLADAQCDLESAKSEAKRAQAKRRDTTMEIAQEEEVVELKKQLAREKRARASAEELVGPEKAHAADADLRRELAREKKLREALELELEDARNNMQAEEGRRDLLKADRVIQRLGDRATGLPKQLEQEKAALAKAGLTPDADNVLSALRAELHAAQQATVRVGETATKREEQWNSDKSALEEKLAQFRTQLKETKSLLKRTQDELTAATERAQKAEHSAEIAFTDTAILTAVPKPIKKKAAAIRAAKVVDPGADETSLGTPGDGPQAKRTRKVADIGSKSHFSITPFLNKTKAPDDDDEQAEASEDEASPTKRKALPLTQAASIKANKKLGGAALQAVTKDAESSPSKMNQIAIVVEPAPAEEAPAAEEDKPAAKLKKKRKSLVDFDTFQKTDNEPVVKQKKRKLGGRGPTLFDDEDADDGAANTTLFGGPSLSRAAPGIRLASAKRMLTAAKPSRTALVSANEGSGSQFSPLRRTRKNLDDTLRG